MVLAGTSGMDYDRENGTDYDRENGTDYNRANGTDYNRANGTDYKSAPAILRCWRRFVIGAQSID
jgi:hypothetical protein